MRAPIIQTLPVEDPAKPFRRVDSDPSKRYYRRTLKVPKVLVREPRLLVPGQFPVTPVQPDKNHSIGEKIRLFLSHGNNNYDTGGEVKKFGGRFGVYSQNTTYSGWIASKNEFKFVQPCTLMCWMDSPSCDNGTHRCFSAIYGSGGYINICTYWNATNTIILNISTYDGYVGQTSKADPAFFGDGLFSYASVCPVGSYPKLYVNGKYISDASNAGSGSLTPGYSSYLVGGARYKGTGENPWNSNRNLLFAIAFSGALSDAEVREMHYNPMQAFVPA